MSINHNMMHNKFSNIVLFLIIYRYIKIVMGSVDVFTGAATSRTRKEVENAKRYLIFPQGSNVQLVYCMTIGTYAMPSGYFTMGVTAGIAWELPYMNSVPYEKPAEVYHRRSRKELYRKVELMLSTYGKDGRTCVHKALCQAGKRDSSQVGKGTFLQEILHSIFTLPNGSYHEDPWSEYDNAYQASSEFDCEKKYATCPKVF